MLVNPFSVIFVMPGYKVRVVRPNIRSGVPRQQDSAARKIGHREEARCSSKLRQFTATQFMQTLSRLGITHRRKAYHQEARASIGRWTEEYNHHRPHRGLQDRTPHEDFPAWKSIQLSETPISVLRDAIHVTKRHRKGLGEFASSFLDLK